MNRAHNNFFEELWCVFELHGKNEDEINLLCTLSIKQFLEVFLPGVVSWRIDWWFNLLSFFTLTCIRLHAPFLVGAQSTSIQYLSSILFGAMSFRNCPFIIHWHHFDECVPWIRNRSLKFPSIAHFVNRKFEIMASWNSEPEAIELQSHVFANSGGKNRNVE